MSIVSKGIGLISGLGKLMPKGGIRHPDSMIRNKSLYVGDGMNPNLNPTIGRINYGKALLTGSRYPRRKKRRWSSR